MRRTRSIATTTTTATRSKRTKLRERQIKKHLVVGGGVRAYGRIQSVTGQESKTPEREAQREGQREKPRDRNPESE